MLGVTIVTNAFEGVPILKRHRIINDILKKECMPHIHALSLNTWTESQYENKKKKSKTDILERADNVHMDKKNRQNTIFSNVH